MENMPLFGEHKINLTKRRKIYDKKTAGKVSEGIR